MDKETDNQANFSASNAIEIKTSSNPAHVNEAFQKSDEIEDSNEIELRRFRQKNEKVVPLYTPDDAVVKVFMIHGSQKSALSLASFALGFQQQVIIVLVKTMSYFI